MHFKPMGPGSAVNKLESVSLNKKGGCQKIYRVNKEKEEGGGGDIDLPDVFYEILDLSIESSMADTIWVGMR